MRAKAWFKFYMLVVLFGYCGWISVNSVWVELPVIVNTLPEGWATPSYLALLVQVAAVGPVAYSLLRRFLPNSKIVQKPFELIIASIAVDALASLLLSFFWSHSVDVNGSAHSVPLFVLFLVHAIVDCTSNVLYMPYMYNFHSTFTNTYFIGLSLSGLIPSLLSIGQGTGNVECSFNNLTNTSQPIAPVARFGVQTFFVLIFFFLLFGLIAFVLLHRLPDSGEIRNIRSAHLKCDTRAEEEERNICKRDFRTLLVITTVICCLVNGALPSIQSYATLPYSQTIFQWVIILSNVTNSVASYLSFYFKASVKLSAALAFLVVLGSAYLFLLALESPHALLKANVGPYLCVIVYSAVTGLTSYLRTTIANQIRNNCSESGMFYCGFFSQLGSFVGAVVMFPLINVFNFFKAASPCP